MAEDVTAAVVPTPGPRSSQACLSSVGAATLCLLAIVTRVDRRYIVDTDKRRI